MRLHDHLTSGSGDEHTTPPEATRPGEAVPARRREVLYDSRRKVFYQKPSWRGWSHLAWFEASVVIGTLLVVADGATRTTAAAIYAASVSGLFVISALYHRGNWRPRARRIVQRFDHLM